MTRHVPAVLAGVLAVACSSAAWADSEETAERSSSASFGYVYTAETEEAGETEFELWATDRRGKGEGHYDARDYRVEVERGITDRFAASIYADFVSHHIRRLEPALAPVDSDLAFQGLSAEFKYSVVKPNQHNIGLTFYAEPGWSRMPRK